MFRHRWDAQVRQVAEARRESTQRYEPAVISILASILRRSLLATNAGSPNEY